jgi:hypothetical protein
MDDSAGTVARRESVNATRAVSAAPQGIDPRVPPTAFSIRTACSDADLAMAQRIRHDAYVDAGWLAPCSDGRLADTYDAMENSQTHLLRFRDADIGTMRTTVWTGAPGWDDVPALKVFGEGLLGYTRGEHFVEMNRFAMLPGYTALGRRPLLLLFRTAVVAADDFSCGLMIASVINLPHVPFYERMGFVHIGPECAYPGLTATAALIIGDYRIERDRLLAHPVFQGIFDTSNVPHH